MARKVEWKSSEIPWHKTEVDNNLNMYIKELTQGRSDASILVTWCGKSVDMPWLCSQGYSVVGIALSEVAVNQFFKDNCIPYTRTTEGRYVVYRAETQKVTIYLGDYYKLTPNIIGRFDAVWDNNAFGSSPLPDRHNYVSVLASLLKEDGQVLVANWEYGKLERHTYPYSLTSTVIKEYFQEKFEVKFLGKCEMFTDYFIKKYNVNFAHRNIHLLSLKL